MSRRPALLLALAGAALLGCGSDDSPKFEGEKADVAAVIDNLGKSARAGDGAAICNDLFTAISGSAWRAPRGGPARAR